MKCGNCKKGFSGRNFGFVGSTGLVDICSPECRSEKRSKAVTGRDAGSGVISSGKPPRKLKPSEIRKAMRPSERDVSRSIVVELDAAGVWNTRTQSGAIKTHSGHIMKLCRKGTPDRIATPGLHVWIEVKKQGEKPSDEQAAAIDELRSNAALAFIIDDPRQWRIIADCLKGRTATIRAIAAAVSTIQAEIDAALLKTKL